MTIEKLVRMAWSSGMGSYHDTKTSKQIDRELEDFIDGVKDEFKNLTIPVVTTCFTFDCWFDDDGEPLKRYIEAKNEDKAIEIFKETYPNMSYDYPYE